MATTMAGMSLSAPRLIAAKSGAESTKASHPCVAILLPWSSHRRVALAAVGRRRAAVVMAAPDSLSEKVAESIKGAEELCSENPASGECVAAWDEVEELSAAASHARDKKKASDPLEDYCKDNPETDECRTYED